MNRCPGQVGGGGRGDDMRAGPGLREEAHVDRGHRHARRARRTCRETRRQMYQERQENRYFKIHACQSSHRCVYLVEVDSVVMNFR